MASVESLIADRLVAIVGAVSGVKQVSFDKIQAASYDFRDHELPAVQLWDIGQEITHQRGRIEVRWVLSLELIMKTKNDGGSVSTVDQKALWDLRRDIQLAIWADPRLGLTQVRHPILTGNITDLHFALPYYIARMDFDVLFYDDLTGSC